MEEPAWGKQLLTAPKVAAILGVTERYVWRWGKEGSLARVKLPGCRYVRFLDSDVEAYIDEGQTPPAWKVVPAKRTLNQVRIAAAVAKGTYPHWMRPRSYLEGR